mmetsp:Transcript_23097/g.46334  ORF Transcript_23097/g.46334 Transcript_23097/m.46334 type:complete len:560 (-) Transcript_23097:260-1939(-)
MQCYSSSKYVPVFLGEVLRVAELFLRVVELALRDEVHSRPISLPVNGDLGTRASDDGEEALLHLEALDHDVFSLENNGGVLAELDLAWLRDLGLELGEGARKRGLEHDLGADIGLDHVVLGRLALHGDVAPGELEVLAAHLVRVGLSGASGLGESGLGLLAAGIHGVVLHGGEAHSTLERDEADLGLGVEQLGVVLHHALEARGLLEDGLLGVLVLGVDELGHHAVRLLQGGRVLGDGEDEDVEVAGVRREAGGIGLVSRVPGSLHQGIQLVVLDVAGQSLVLALELADGTHGLPRLARDGDGVDLELFRDGHAEGRRGGVEDESIGVLEEHEVLAALRGPLLGETGVVDELVHVSVAVGLGLQREGVVLLRDEGGVVVSEGGHLLLLHDHDLSLGHAEVVVLLQEIHGLGVGVSAGHDGKREHTVGGTSLAGLSLKSEDVLAVEVEVARLGDSFIRKLNLDTVVPKTLTEPSRNKAEGSVLDDLHASSLHLVELLVAEGQHDARRLHRGVPFERVATVLGELQEFLGVLDVPNQTSRVLAVKGYELLGEHLLLGIFAL